MYCNFLGMQIVMIYFLWSGPMIPTSKVERENNKSWYWQRNMRQLLIFCLLLTSFPLHVICFTGYSLSEALGNQVLSKCYNRLLVLNYNISTRKLQVQYMLWTSNCFLICSFYKNFDTMNLQNWKLVCT